MKVTIPEFTPYHLFLLGLTALLLGTISGLIVHTQGFMVRVGGSDGLHVNVGGKEGFLVRVGGTEGFEDSPVCSRCGERPCKPTCPPVAPCPRVQEPDLSKYVLKSQIPAPRPNPDLSNYMLKTECPPVPDLSKYVLKSSIPKPQPVIIDNSMCKKDAGECPPCPRPRCPVVKCPAPTVCPKPADCPRQVCPPTVVKCKSEEAVAQNVRPYLSPISMTGFGKA